MTSCDRYGKRWQIWQAVTDMTKLLQLPIHIWSRLLAFYWCIYIRPWLILKVKVKVMTILTVNTSQAVTDRTNIVIANIYIKSPIGFRLVYLHLILTHHFLLWISRKRWNIEQILILPIHRKSPVGIRLVYLHWTLTHSNGQYEDHEQFDSKYLTNGSR